VKKLFQLLKQRSDQKSIRREVCWSLSNITCRRDTLDLVMDNPEYIDQLINVALNDVLEVSFSEFSNHNVFSRSKEKLFGF